MSASTVRFHKMKREPAQPGVDNMGKKITKLELLNSIQLAVNLFSQRAIRV